jgi:hypothetical protein
VARTLLAQCSGIHGLHTDQDVPGASDVHRDGDVKPLKRRCYSKEQLSVQGKPDRTAACHTEGFVSAGTFTRSTVAECLYCQKVQAHLKLKLLNSKRTEPALGAMKSSKIALSSIMDCVSEEFVSYFLHTETSVHKSHHPCAMLRWRQTRMRMMIPRWQRHGRGDRIVGHAFRHPQACMMTSEQLARFEQCATQHPCILTELPVGTGKPGHTRTS